MANIFGLTEYWGKRTYIMGILNLTPDSFSDGGKYISPTQSLNRVEEMIREGADIIDIGGESTRPGGNPIDLQTELSRIIPTLEFLKEKFSIPISIDTYRSATAYAALEAGADMINDVCGLKSDPEMANVIASYKVPVCIMHNSPTSNYKDLVDDIQSSLDESIEIALKAGIQKDNIIIDPGIGFGKTWTQNIEILKALDRFKQLGYPLLLGTSRKSFIGKVLDLEVGERLEGTLATSVFGIVKGADILRVHDILQNKRVSIMTDRMVRNFG